jgi:hypothetical protein
MTNKEKEILKKPLIKIKENTFYLPLGDYKMSQKNLDRLIK